MATSNELVLVTGATGFLGAHLIARSLAAGYRVRGTVRKYDHIKKLENYFSPQYGNHVEFVVVENLTRPGVYDNALKDVNYVFHTASPVVAQSTRWKEDHIDPAVKGTTNLLKAANAFPNVKRVVLPNTFGALMPLGGFEDFDHVMSEKDRDAATADPDSSFPNPFVAYFAGKILADKAAYDFLATEKPHYSIVTLYLGYLFGRNLLQERAEDIASSNLLMWAVTHGQMSHDLNFGLHIDNAVDAHFRALDPKIQTGEGFFVSAKPFLWEDVVALAEKTYPGLGWKLASASTEQMRRRKIDTSKAERVLGLKFKPLEEGFLDVMKMQVELSQKKA